MSFMLLASLSLFLNFVVSARLKFQISYREKDIPCTDIICEERHDTWLAPHVYLKRDKLPSFRQFVSTFIVHSKTDEAVCNELPENVVLQFAENFAHTVEELRMFYICKILESHTAPDRDFPEESLDTLYSTIKQDYPDHGEYLTSIVSMYVFPVCKFWLASNDIKTDEPLFMVEYSSLLGQLSFHVKVLLKMFFGGKDCITNPCGLGLEYTMSLYPVCQWDDCDIEQMRSFIDQVLCLDLTSNWDENLIALYDLEKTAMSHSVVFRMGHKISLLCVPSESEASLLKHIIVPNMRGKHNYLSPRQLYCDMKSLVQGPIEYRPKSKLEFKTEVIKPFILQILPQEVIAIVISLVSEQPVNFLRLVCKAFYLAFNDMQCESRNWPPAVPVSSRKNFLTASVMTELQKEDPDYEAFAEWLIDLPFAGFGDIIVGSIVCPDEYRDCPEMTANWTRMMDTIKAAYEAKLKAAKPDTHQ